MHATHLKSLAYLSAGNGCDPVEEIEAAAAAGFQAVGLRPLAPLGLAIPHPIVGQPAVIREIRSACGRTGVAVLDCEVITLTAATEVAEVLPLLATVAEIGCGIVQATSEDADWNRGVDNFARVCDEAARFGLRVAFEFMRWRAVKTLPEAVRFVEAAARANGGIVLDTLHLSRSGGSPADVAKAPAERLFYLQLCDAPGPMPQSDEDLIREARGGRLYPGQGTLWLHEVLDRLPAGIPISIEVPPPASARTTHERAHLAGEALDAWLAAHRAR